MTYYSSIAHVSVERICTTFFNLDQSIEVTLLSFRFTGLARLNSSQNDVLILVLKPGTEDGLVASLNFIYLASYVFGSMTCMVPPR